MTRKTTGFAKAGARPPLRDLKKFKPAAYRKTMRARRNPAPDELVQIPAAKLDALHARIEDLEDARDRNAAARITKPGDYLPAALMDRIIAGEHPLRIWREHRGLTSRALAEKADIPVSYLSEIENRKKPGSLEAYRALAEALDLTIDDLAP